MNQEDDASVPSESPETSAEVTEKLPASAHVMCGWPLLLIAVGGAIGGGLGGAAYGVNVGIYRSKLPVPVKVVLNLAVGMAAIGIWLAVAVAIQARRG